MDISEKRKDAAGDNLHSSLYDSLNDGMNSHNPERTVRPPMISSGVDFVLPDYLGDIKRVLNYSAGAIPSGRFVGSEKLSFVGIVCYSVIYLDSENKLTEASFTSDYEYDEKIPEGFVDAEGSCEVAGLSVRLIGPRKISAKATLSPEIIITEKRCPDYPENTEGLELLSAQISESSLELIRSAEREYAEEVARLEGVSCEEVQEVLSGGYVKPSSCECTEEGIRLSGTLELYAILLIEGNMTIRVEKSIPVSELLEGECADGVKFIPTGCLTSLRVSMNNTGNADSDGKDDGGFSTSVTFDATVEYLVKAYKNRMTAVVKDAFSCSCHSICEFKNYSYTELSDLIRDEREISFTIDKSELDTSEIGDILDTSATVKLTSVNSDMGDIILEGEINTVTLMQTAEESGFTSHKATHHFREALRPGAKLCDGAKIIALPSSCSASTTLDSSRLYIKCSLATDIMIKEDKTLKIVGSVSRKEEEPTENTSAVTVYYPTADDSLWSIAKKYRVPPVVLAEENMLDASCLSSGGDATLGECKRIIISKIG